MSDADHSYSTSPSTPQPQQYPQVQYQYPIPLSRICYSIEYHYIKFANKSLGSLFLVMGIGLFTAGTFLSHGLCSNAHS
jgi:hypothetical protein